MKTIIYLHDNNNTVIITQRPERYAKYIKKYPKREIKILTDKLTQ
jgi:hypothetical protein